MRRILDFIRQTVGGDDLLHQIDERETAFAELPHDSEPILVDPDVAASVDGVVKRVQSRERTPHTMQFLLPQSPLLKPFNTTKILLRFAFRLFLRIL